MKPPKQPSDLRTNQSPSQEPSQRREPASWFFCKSTSGPPPCAALPGRQLALPELRSFGAAPPTGCPRWSSGRSRPAAAGDRAVCVVVHRPFLTAARSRPALRGPGRRSAACEMAVLRAAKKTRGVQLAKTRVSSVGPCLLCMGETCLILTLQFQIAGAGSTSWTLRKTGLRHLLR